MLFPESAMTELGMTHIIRTQILMRRVFDSTCAFDFKESCQRRKLGEGGKLGGKAPPRRGNVEGLNRRTTPLNTL